jgi:hypothetical protein
MSDAETLRLTNAALMLRILERQLMSELQHIQDSVYELNSQRANRKPKALSRRRRALLRENIATPKTLEAQPTCPICASDYCDGEKLLELPCRHLYHESCVMPWLESKGACPTCRCELVPPVPSLEALETQSMEALMKMLSDTGGVLSNCENSKTELAQILHARLVMKEQDEKALEEEEEEEEEAAEQSNLASGPGSESRPQVSSSSAAIPDNRMPALREHEYEYEYELPGTGESTGVPGLFVPRRNDPAFTRFMQAISPDEEDEEGPDDALVDALERAVQGGRESYDETREGSRMYINTQSQAPMGVTHFPGGIMIHANHDGHRSRAMTYSIRSMNSNSPLRNDDYDSID